MSKWTPTRVSAELRRFRAERGWPSARRLERSGQETLVAAGRQLFGSHRAALRAAGIEWGMRLDCVRQLSEQRRFRRTLRAGELPIGLQADLRTEFGSVRAAIGELTGEVHELWLMRWSPEVVLEELRRFRREEAWPTLGRLRAAHGPGLLVAIEVHFGGLIEARLAAGLKQREPVPREDVLLRLRALRRAGRWPRYEDLDPALRRDIRSQFGSFARAREATEPQPYEPWTADRIVARLRELDAQGIRITTNSLLQAGESRVVGATYKIFGGFPTARNRAGIAAPSPARTAFAAEEALNEIRARAKALGRTPHATELRPVVYNRLREAYGSYPSVLAKAGLAVPPAPNARWTPEVARAELRKEYDAGLRITTSELLAAGRTDLLLAIHKHFGSFTEAREAAGIPDMRQPRYLTDEEVRELRRRAAEGTPQIRLADDYDLSRPAVSSLVRGLSRWDAGGPLPRERPPEHAKSGRWLTELSDDEVRAVRERYNRDEATFQDVAREFGLGGHQVGRLVRGETRVEAGGPILRRPRPRRRR